MPSKFKRLAAIDVGSNSLHLVIAKVSPDGKFSVLDKMKAPVRLGEGGGKFLHLSDDAISEGVKALKSFAKIAKENNVDAIRAVATSAVREAENKDVFVEKVFNESGINIEVVSGYEESRLIFLGASKSLELEKSKIGLCDIGGGSAELLSANNGELAFATSFKIGAIRMSEKYFPNEDVNQLQVEDCKEFIRNEIFLAAETIKNNGFKKFVGTSGTIQTLASMVLAMRGEKIPDNLNGVTIKRKEIDEITENIIQAKNFSKRAKLPGMDPKRADIIVAGAITFQTILYSLDVKEFVVSNYALREGILIDWIDKQISESSDEIAGYHLGNERLESILITGNKYQFSEIHGTHVCKMALKIYDDLFELHNLPQEARAYLEAASLLHDIGYFISKSSHHKHSLYLIRHSKMYGFTENELGMIGNTTRYHRKSHPKITHNDYQGLSIKEKEIVNKLASILRIAEGLDRSHKQIVNDIGTKFDKDSITFNLKINNDEDPQLEVWSAERKKGLMEEVYERNIKFEF